MANKSQQEGGSAENTGRFRNDQINKSVHTDEQNRERVAKEIKEKSQDVSGSSDRKEEQNTGKPTQQ